MKKIVLIISLVAFFTTGKAQINTHSASFDGTTAYASVGDAASLNPTAALTIEAWIKPTAFGTNVWDNYIVGKDDWTVSSAGYCLRCGAGGELSFNFSDGLGGWQEVITSAVIPTGSWTHVAGTFDGTTLTAYVNGVAQGTTTFSGSINPSSYPIYIGGVPYTLGGTRLFNGLIDGVEIWNVALTSTQINAYMLCPPHGAETGLVGLWKFEEGTGTAAADSTANHNNATMMGALWSTDVQAYTCPHAGIDEYNVLSYSLYPNPANGVCTITFNKPVENASVKLYNVLGEKCFEEAVKSGVSKEINVGNLASGIYLMQVNSDGKQYSQRLVIE